MKLVTYIQFAPDSTLNEARERRAVTQCIIFDKQTNISIILPYGN
jgi:hypothetical protein